MIHPLGAILTDSAAPVQSFVTSHYSTEFLYFPLNQGSLPAGSTHKPKFNISTWDYLDDKASAHDHPFPSIQIAQLQE